MTYFTYLHARPNTDSINGIFYVGKGRRARMSPSVAQNRNSHHKNVVKKYGVENILVGSFECSSEQIAFDLEKGLIKLLRKHGVELANKTDGGEGISGFKHPPHCSGENHPMKRAENRAKVSGDKSPTKRPEVRAKMSAAAAKRVITDDWRQSMSDAQRLRLSDPLEREKVGAYSRGRVRMNNGVSERSVNPTEVDELLSQGWVRGRIYHARKPASEETRRKISESNKGRTAHNKGKSSKLIGTSRPKEICDKISATRKGGRWITDGITSRYIYTDEVPEGWRYGRVSNKCV